MADTTPAPSNTASPTPPVTNAKPATASAQSTGVEQEYFFPQYGKTIKAASREEAEKKLAALEGKS